ncbi:MAG: transcription antitermination factor NusB [Clostridiales bacterium]|nr:transcription antitermination factor NusB [Clostridiales bacterium]
MTRSEMREQAFVLLFEKEFFKDKPVAEIEQIYTENVSELSDYGRAVFEGCAENIEEIDKTISTYLRSWRLERIAKVSLAVLRLAFYEMLYVDEVPGSISASEAVNLTKKYANQKDASFVNGIIGSHLRSAQNAQKN